MSLKTTVVAVTDTVPLNLRAPTVADGPAMWRMAADSVTRVEASVTPDKGDLFEADLFPDGHATEMLFRITAGELVGAAGGRAR